MYYNVNTVAAKMANYNYISTLFDFGGFFLKMWLPLNTNHIN